MAGKSKFTPEERRAIEKAKRRERYLAQRETNDFKKERANYMRAWRKKNPESVRALNRANYSANAKERRRYAAGYKSRNPDAVKLGMKLWYAKNAERQKKCSRRWRAMNPEKSTAIRRRACGKRRALLAATLIGSLNRITEWENKWRSKRVVTCHWCGGTFPSSVCHSDHVQPLSKGGAHSVENLAVSCASCNLSKGSKTPMEWTMGAFSRTTQGSFL